MYIYVWVHVHCDVFSTGFSITPSIYLLSMHPSLSLNISTNLCVVETRLAPVDAGLRATFG